MMEYESVHLVLPYKVDEQATATLEYKYERGEKKFVQYIYSHNELRSVDITETVFKCFLRTLAFKNAVFNPLHRVPDKVHFTVNQIPAYVYINLEMDRVLNKSLDEIHVAAYQSELETMCENSGKVDLDYIVSKLPINSINELIDAKESVQ